MPIRITLAELQTLATRALERAGTSSVNAALVAEALVAADADGIASHGVSRLPFYADPGALERARGKRLQFGQRDADGHVGDESSVVLLVGESALRGAAPRGCE